MKIFFTELYPRQAAGQSVPTYVPLPSEYNVTLLDVKRIFNMKRSVQHLNVQSPSADGNCAPKNYLRVPVFELELTHSEGKRVHYALFLDKDKMAEEFLNAFREGRGIDLTTIQAETEAAHDEGRNTFRKALNEISTIQAKGSTRPPLTVGTRKIAMACQHRTDALVCGA
ncbi:MAG TPA: hypothetical protein DCY07_05685 [Rhodospirillaceae bacterium]|nr:hypothetical protein [Rhodospirillaceae bacterium]